MLEESAVKLDPIAEALSRLEGGKGPHKILLKPTSNLVNVRRGDGWQLDCDCVLVREDGFTLGCRREQYDAAIAMSPRRWVAVIAYANTQHRVVVALRIKSPLSIKSAVCTQSRPPTAVAKINGGNRDH